VHDFGATMNWNHPSLERLWLYNLHYFDDLNSQGAVSRSEWHRALLTHWVRENQPGRGTGWEPYPTSLRVVNWIKWAFAGNALHPECVHSMAIQVRWLTKRLEIHLLGNHLFANAKALVFAGLFFRGPEAERWLNAGLRILERELPEQILGDGGQFERSPMYHALALEDMLDLCNAIGGFPSVIPERWKALVAGWPKVADRMQYWLAAMCHPDGEISFFNDAAIGISPSPAELGAYAERVGLQTSPAPDDGVTHLPESGYIRVQHGAMVALLDVAPVGPDYLPGHAHADTLSFELSLFGKRVLVNSGTSRYGIGVERVRERGTAAHNTISIDGQDSSEVWSGFRVARRAKPVLSSLGHKEGGVVVRASHDGYRRLRGKNVHQRQWILRKGSAVIEDEITGTFEYAEARFHLHPDVMVCESNVDSGRVVLSLPEKQQIVFLSENQMVQLEPCDWHPEFGATVPNICLMVRFQSSKLRTIIEWEEDD
jgi:uncharacterized heparinase superfamily protein